MKLTINRELLAKELAICARAAEKKSFTPILANTMLAADATGLTITNLDMELAIISRINCEPEPGVACVNADKLLHYVQGISADTLTLEAKGSFLHLGANGGRARLAILGDMESFPVTAAPLPDAEEFEIPADELLYLIGQVSYCIARREASGIVIHSCLMQRRKEGWKAAAIDGWKMAIANMNHGGAPGEFLASQRFCAELPRVASGHEGSILISSDDNNTRATCGNRTIIARKRVERFPAYEGLLKKDPPIDAPVNRAAFRRIISVATNFASQDPNGLLVGLRAGNAKLSVIAKSADGEYEESIPIEFDGEPVEPHVTAGGLLDALGVIETDQVRVCLWGPRDPIHLIPVGGPTVLHLVQPRMP